MRLKAIDISPERNINKIAGPNRAGKSSLLEAIKSSLAGTKEFPAMPVHKGDEKAELMMVLGNEKPELLIMREITPDGKSTLKIKNADGYDAPSPQAILNDLYGRIAIDPTSFMLMEDSKQLDILRKLVGLDFEELDQQHAELYSQRTQENKTAKSLAAQLAAFVIPEGTPETEISVADLNAEWSNRSAKNKANEAERSKLKDCIFRLATTKRDIAATENAIKTTKEQIAKFSEILASQESCLQTEQEGAKGTQAIYDAQKATVSVLEDANVDEIRQKITDAQTTNQNVSKRKQKNDLATRVTSTEAESTRLTGLLDKIAADKQTAMSTAKWPVEGMSFDKNGILYNGIPFSQASDEEKLTVSAAMSAAQNPDLKVMLLRHASLIKGPRLDALCKFAEEHDMQIFMEFCTDENSKESATVIIEDGTIIEGGNEPDKPLEMTAKPKRTRKPKAVLANGSEIEFTPLSNNEEIVRGPAAETVVDIEPEQETFHFGE